MKGEAVRNTSTLYRYQDELGGNAPSQAGLEELQTIGIFGNYRYTENKIRKEHGIGWRRMY